MKILLTGATSFTGYWFVKALAEAGHEIVCPTSRPLDCGEGVRQERVNKLKPICRLLPNMPFGSEPFLSLVRSGNWDLFCHHGAEVGNYHSPSFDAQAALEKNTLNLGEVLIALRDRGSKGIVLTGTVFENDEGVGSEPRRAFSPYGLSKGLTYQTFRHHCAQLNVPLGKFVIPNPFGPFEEARFTAYLMRTWAEGKVATVKTPDYVRDNIHADLLAAVYRQFACKLAGSSEPLARSNPSGYVESQGAFALRVAREVRSRTGWACELDLAQQNDFSEPLVRINSQPATLLVPGWVEKAAWDAFVDFYSRKRPGDCG